MVDAQDGHSLGRPWVTSRERHLNILDVQHGPGLTSPEIDMDQDETHKTYPTDAERS